MSSREFNGQERSVEQDTEQKSGDREECPDCQGQVNMVGGEKVCRTCGLVVEENCIDRGPEWRTFETDKRDRTGAPITPTRHDRGLSTEIGFGTDGKGNPISGRKRRQLGRLRREHDRGRWRSKAERNLALGLVDVRRIAGALDLPESIRDQACTLFRSAQGEDLLRGRSIEAFTAGCLYAVCRCNGLPRTIEEVKAFARCGGSAVENAYSVLNKEFGLAAKPPLAQDYVPRLASDLNVGETVQRRALDLAREADDAGLVNGCQPSGFAAACLYIAADEQGEGVSQLTAAHAADVSTATVRANRDKIRSFDFEDP